jgi:hypothetical protein
VMMMMMDLQKRHAQNLEEQKRENHFCKTKQDYGPRLDVQKSHFARRELWCEQRCVVFTYAKMKESKLCVR